MMDANEADAEYGLRPKDLYRGHLLVTAEEAAAVYPEAMVLFDQQCGDLAERSDVLLCIGKKKRLSVELPDRDYHKQRTIWRPAVGLWVRYSCHISPQMVCARCLKWRLFYEFNNPEGGEPVDKCIFCRRQIKRVLPDVKFSIILTGQIHYIQVTGTADV